jgi:hypothetical protein
LNHQFASEVVEPIQYGIGIHAGVVIVGDIGFRGHTVFTALGDAVNVASRLQDLTKELDCKVVVSEEVCKTAGPAGDALTRRDVAIRHHDGAMAVRTAVDPTVLASLVDPVAESDEPLPTAVAAEWTLSAHCGGDIAAVHGRDIRGGFQFEGLVQESLRDIFGGDLAAEKIAGHVNFFIHAARFGAGSDHLRREQAGADAICIDRVGANAFGAVIERILPH